MNRVLFDETPRLKEFRDFLISDYCPKTEYPIHIKHSEVEDDIIYFEIEQYTDDKNVDMLSHYENLKKENIKEIWTFSRFNIKILNENGIANCRYIEIIPTDEYYEKLLSYNPDNTFLYDVSFVGWLSSYRRTFVLEMLKNKGVRVNIINLYGDKFGEERDRIIAKSKILLNIHFNENWKCFEQIRCFPWLKTDKVIISESSYDENDRVIFVDYDKLVDTVIDVLNTKF